MALHAESDRVPKLLQQLQLDAGQRDEEPSYRHRWLISCGLGLAVLCAGAATAFVFLRGEGWEVEAATAIGVSSVGGPTATLQATGYVTARRRATVSAQITGTLVEVLIEEGEYVKAGQVLTRLESGRRLHPYGRRHHCGHGFPRNRSRR